MPLTVQQLNADTTFLLTFTLPTASATNNGNTGFSILIDPWLTGPSPIFHSAFAVSRHTTESAIQSLAELSRLPDVVIISQPKNDHCNREALCTLPKSWQGTIVAVPAAAKKIRAWKHFDEDRVQVLPAYSSKKPTTVARFPLRPTSKTEGDGEITIANIPEPYDLSAVHNAIGIIYHPLHSTTPSKPFSILYTPHGLTPSLLEPYLTNHLRPLNADPVDLLFHSLNIEANPKLMGGVVSNGAPGGVAIAKMLGVKEWIAAHDEEKENGGLATKLVKNTIYGVEEVEGLLEKEEVLGVRVHKLGVGETLTVHYEGSEGVNGGHRDPGCNAAGAFLNSEG